MKFCLLASGSSGNCGYVKTRETEILVDAGISVSRVKRELEALGTSHENISALFITHEHGDHTAHIVRLAHNLNCPIFITDRTRANIPHMFQKQLEVINFDFNEPIEWGEFEIEPFPVVHDAIEPCGFVFHGESDVQSERVALGYATDVGHVTEPLMAAFRKCRAVVLEANHDLKMLRNGTYPEILKKRIRSPRGHLSNADAAQLIRTLVELGNLEVALLAHLSSHNNKPDLAVDTVCCELDGLFSCNVYPSYKHRPSALLTI